MNKIILALTSTLIFSFLFSSMYFTSSVSANLVVDPAKLGILRLQLYPLSPAVAIREFRIGNTYDVPMNIELELTEDMINLITLSEANFTLPPNENKTVEYTVTINEPGYYSGGILVKADIEGRGRIGYNADLSVFVNRSNLQPYFYVVILAIIVAIVLIFILFFRKVMQRKSKKR